MSQYGFFVDQSRCIGCNQCTVACMQWHDIQPGPVKGLDLLPCGPEVPNPSEMLNSNASCSVKGVPSALLMTSNAPISFDFAFSGTHRTDWVFRPVILSILE